MYSEKVMDHFEHPRNVGEIEDASGVGTVGNAKCGEDVYKRQLWNLSKCKGSCNVCGAFQITAAGVCKEEPIFRDWYIAIFGCAVVNLSLIHI